MSNNRMERSLSDLEASLKINCEACSGLCCVALYCMKTDGFPANKEAGIPCKHLQSDFRCNIHSTLAEKQMRGCLAYDCFGAGQKVMQKYPPNLNWNTNPEQANELFQVFLTVVQLHQMEWYLLEALSLVSVPSLNQKILALISQNEQMTLSSPSALLQVAMEPYRQRVNELLKQVCSLIGSTSFEGAKNKDYMGKTFKRANLNDMDFSMAFLIAADLEGCSLHHTNFLGADLRGAILKNTDLSSCLFLTQMQINTAKGNANTKLPSKLSRPACW